MNNYINYIKDKLVFDVGANSGSTVANFLHLGASKIIAIEPCPDVFRDLTINFGKNERVILENLAVSNNCGKAILFMSGGRTTNTLSKEFMNRTGKQRFPAGSWRESVEVETSTLNNLITKYGVPSFCKIDVEGSELQVIQGLSHPIPFVTFEFTAEFMKESFECIDILSSLDSYNYNFAINDSELAFVDFVDSAKIKVFLQEKFNADYYNFGMIHARKI